MKIYPVPNLVADQFQQPDQLYDRGQNSRQNEARTSRHLNIVFIIIHTNIVKYPDPVMATCVDQD